MVEFGVLLLADDVRGLGERVRRAEAAGFSRIGIGDSQSLFHELYVCLTVAALNTEKALVGPMVTNPLTRHPAVTAAAIATLDELTGGRAFLGLGTGDSAVHNLGYKPVSRARLRRYVDAVRRLLAGEEVDWEGGIGHTRWVRRPVPIILSAEGPRILKLAGEVADGAVVHTGLSADLVHDSFQRVEDGAKGVGRDPAELELSVFAKCNIDDDPDRAVGEIKMALAASGHHAFRHSLEDKHVPAELEGAVLRLVEEYEPAQHEQLGVTVNAELPDRLGLTEFLADRFAIAGTPEQCRERVRALLEVGVRRFLITAIGPDPDRIVERFGREVIAKLA